MRLISVIEFYQPYVSLDVPPSTQHKQMVFQIAFPLLLALLASTPMFVARYWGYAITCTLICFVVLHTLRGLRNWAIAYPNAEGMLYISPSNSPSLVYLVFVTIVLACLVFMVSPYANQ